MTPKRIEYTDHAAQRMRQRDITRQDVRWLLAKGLRERLGQDGRAWLARGDVRGREAHVIYLEDGARVLILTVEWKETPAQVAKHKRKEKGE